MKLLVEAVIVGIVLIIVGNLVSILLRKAKIGHVELPSECKKWNEKYIMEISLFLTGVLTHLFFEMIGANGWYCKNGNACL